MPLDSTLSLTRSLRRKLFVALLACAVPAVTFSQQQQDEKNQPSDAGSEAITEIAKFFETNNFDGALAAIRKAKPKFKGDTFDFAYLTQMEAIALLQKKDYAGALQPLETALTLANKYGYFKKEQVLELTFNTAQIYGQIGSESKDPKVQRQMWQKSYDYITDWLKKNPKPNADGEYFAAQAAYSVASAGAGEQLDVGMMKVVEQHCQNALRMQIKPREHAMLLLVAALQQQKRFQEAAEVSELMVKYFPNNKSYWSNLANAYILIAETKQKQSEKDEQYIKAIVTFERAQKIGLLNTPKDNYYVVGLLINTNQHDAAIDLLENGLRNGKLEPTEQNWQLLAQSYQIIKKDEKAIETYKEAAKLFPKNSSHDLNIANLYYGMDKLPEALEYLRSALKKGVEKPAPTQVFVAYIALELKRLDEAKAAAEEALRLDPSSQDAQRLLESANSEIADRENILNARRA